MSQPHPSPGDTPGETNAHAHPTHSGTGPPASADTIVVGHDGSRFAEHSLEVALKLAERIGAPVMIVRSWNVDTAPHGVLFAGGYVASFDEVSSTIEDNMAKELHAAVARHEGVVVEYRAAFGQAAEILIKLSHDALMLVVGSRGRGGFASLMLGSSSEQVVRHANCPVLVVRMRK
jgi:nucleotide-binding universal stress UspA family protein